MSSREAALQSQIRELSETLAEIQVHLSQLTSAVRQLTAQLEYERSLLRRESAASQLCQEGSVERDRKHREQMRVMEKTNSELEAKSEAFRHEAQVAITEQKRLEQKLQKQTLATQTANETIRVIRELWTRISSGDQTDADIDRVNNLLGTE